MTLLAQTGSFFNHKMVHLSFTLLQLLSETGSHFDQKLVHDSLDKNMYWHAALGDLSGKQVLVRSAPNYLPPDAIEVYYDDEWICSAFDTRSEAGKAVTAKDVRNAQIEQRKAARKRIHDARDEVRKADAEIEALPHHTKSQGASPAQTPEAGSHDVPPTPQVSGAGTSSEELSKEAQPKAKPRSGLLDVLGAHYATESRA